MLEFLILLILCVTFVYLRFRKKGPSYAELKGLAGEQKVNDILKTNKFIYFYDTLLKQGQATSQMDHIVVFPNKTVVVIETKNKDGMITGHLGDDQWLQVIGKNHYQFYSPVKQNEGHIKMLYKKMDQYGLYGYKVLSLVVFTSNKCTLREVPPGVIYVNQLSSTLNSVRKRTLFNRSRKFIQMLIKEDLSKNKKLVQKHKEFAKDAKYFK